MSGESELRTLLKSMNPELRDGEFVFCTLPDGVVPKLDSPPVCQFREAEGLTFVIERAQAERLGLKYAFPCRLITLSVHSDLNAVGFLAAITARLASQKISVNAVSAYYHDHLFVPTDRANDAMEILRGLAGH